jgi:hypothetical protein
MKKLKIKKSDVGRWITVKWNDVGRIDCVLVNVDMESKSAKVFEPHGNLHTVELNQILEKRAYLNAQ